MAGRPREHDEQTARALLDEAERLVEAEGAAALTVRRVAEGVGVSTRAVYSVYGSKDGLLVALGARGFDLLLRSITARPRTADPVADLVEAGIAVFRQFAVEHPALFQVAIQWSMPDRNLAARFRDEAWQAWDGLTDRIEPLERAGLLGGRSVHEAALEFHALCEGLAAVESRGMLPKGEAERLWREALGALVRGFAEPGPPRRQRKGTVTGPGTRR
jgi:AcrR family transcriptional regulator